MRLTIVTGFFLPVPPLRGGSTEKIWDRLAREFAVAGHEVTFVSRRCDGLPAEEVVDGVRHVRVAGAEHSRSLAVNLWHDAVWGLRVSRRLPAADAVICNTVTLPVWLRRLKPSAGRVVAVMARMPKGHGRAYGGVDCVLSLSAAVSEKLAAENPRLAARIASFPYPIDCHLHARAAADWASATNTGVLTIGYVGRIHPEKGLTLLVRAAVQLSRQPGLPPWRLELVGPWTVPEGGGGIEFRDALLAEAGDAFVGRISFAGPEFDKAKLAARYAAMDVFCYPSIAEHGETFGVAVAEAMAARSVPVVSSLQCFTELVQPGHTGLVFDHGASDAPARLASTLAQLLTDPPTRERLATAAQAHVQKYDFAVSARAVLDHLHRLVRRP